MWGGEGLLRLSVARGKEAALTSRPPSAAPKEAEPKEVRRGSLSPPGGQRGAAGGEPWRVSSRRRETPRCETRPQAPGLPLTRSLLSRAAAALAKRCRLCKRSLSGSHGSPSNSCSAGAPDQRGPSGWPPPGAGSQKSFAAHTVAGPGQGSGPGEQGPALEEDGWGRCGPSGPGALPPPNGEPPGKEVRRVPESLGSAAGARQDHGRLPQTLPGTGNLEGPKRVDTLRSL